MYPTLRNSENSFWTNVDFRVWSKAGSKKVDAVTHAINSDDFGVIAANDIRIEVDKSVVSDMILHLFGPTILPDPDLSGIRN